MNGRKSLRLVEKKKEQKADMKRRNEPLVLLDHQLHRVPTNSFVFPPHLGCVDTLAVGALLRDHLQHAHPECIDINFLVVDFLIQLWGHELRGAQHAHCLRKNRQRRRGYRGDDPSATVRKWSPAAQIALQHDHDTSARAANFKQVLPNRNNPWHRVLTGR